MSTKPIDHLLAFTPEGETNAIVETPQGSRNKFDYNPKSGLFELGAAMPAGASFPFEFGFIPSTLGEDGDPLDVLILMDAPTFVGCLARVRLVGVIEVKQTDKGDKFIRNDRLIAVPIKSRIHESVRSLHDLPKELLAEIEHFFASYNQMKGRRFKVVGRHGPHRAQQLVKAGIHLAKKSQ